MKKKLLRLSKRILILMLCTALISGSVINRYKITANAAAMAASVSAWGAYEICMFLGSMLKAALGVGVAVGVFENRDEIVELGKEFIDNVSFDVELPDWIIVKATAGGQQQVYGREVLDYIRAMTLSAVLAGGASPENNNNNDDDDDDEPETAPDVTPEEKQYHARTVELGKMTMTATAGFMAAVTGAVSSLVEGIRNGEENLFSQVLNIPAEAISEDIFYHGKLETNSSGQYVYKAVTYGYEGEEHYKCIISGKSTSRLGGYINSNTGRLCKWGASWSVDMYMLKNNSWILIESAGSRGDVPAQLGYCCNFPIFTTSQQALDYYKSGIESDVLNYPKTYQIADWLQEHWTSTLEQLNTGIRSLADNMLIVGEAANQAMINQANGLGYIEDLATRIATAVPLALPSTMQDPVYFPADSSVPKLDPSTFPWAVPSPVPDPLPDAGGTGNLSDDDIRGGDSFGLDILFSILSLLIMILVMLLMIFLSCLAFIIMIFRIPATTGFLPPDMIAGLNYLKTLEITGFGMSVYDFFMALIYIILIFTVIGILRKNIDKLKFPRKGKW